MTLKQKIWRLSFVFAGLGAILLFIGKMMGGYAGFYVDGRGLHSIGENREESICKDEKSWSAKCRTGNLRSGRSRPYS